MHDMLESAAKGHLVDQADLRTRLTCGSKQQPGYRRAIYLAWRPDIFCAQCDEAPNVNTLGTGQNNAPSNLQALKQVSAHVLRQAAKGKSDKSESVTAHLKQRLCLYHWCCMSSIEFRSQALARERHRAALARKHYPAGPP